MRELMKVCSFCKKSKNISEFNKNARRKDGKDSSCRQCKQDYFHSKKGVTAIIYGGQKLSSKMRGHNPPTYSSKEIREWLFSQKKFHVLYDNWKRLDYQKRYKPSVDRIDDSLGYTMANIQLMTWGENEAKGSADIRSGKITHGNKPQRAVMQFNMNDDFVAEYVSLSEAERQIGIDHSNISACCRGKRNHTGGYKFKYKEKS